jgi:urease accessory protein
MNEGASHLPLLRLLQLSSPALPIGAYAYSRGLESAVHFGWVRDEAGALDWIQGTLERSVASIDGPILVRVHEGFRTGDTALVERWNAFLCAARESRELALEDRQLGLALARVLSEHGVPGVGSWKANATYATMFALAAVHFGIDALDALAAYLFAFAENQVSCAIKLVPLGQSAGQRILSALIGSVGRLVRSVVELGDEQIGSYAPRVALGSALHETQYTRLFRS